MGGLVARPGLISLAELKDEALFKSVLMTVTLQCSGTRRIEQIDYAPGEGDEMINAPWAEGAIGTAVYRGVKLTKLLKHFGSVIEPGQHVEATGYAVQLDGRGSSSQRRHLLQEERARRRCHRHGTDRLSVSNYRVSVGLRLAKLNEAMVVWEVRLLWVGCADRVEVWDGGMLGKVGWGEGTSDSGGGT